MNVFIYGARSIILLLSYSDPELVVAAEATCSKGTKMLISIVWIGMNQSLLSLLLESNLKF